ncbi:MAG: nucleoside hydrolase [Alphaproteobacteria bacterium]
MVALPVLIDCDPGQDDAIALLLALASPAELDVRAVTTVAGNVPLSHTERNARLIVALAGRRDVPVHAGRDRPLRGRLITAKAVVGPSGIDPYPLDAPAVPLAPGHAVDVIVAHCRAAGPDGLTLVATGPLTNIAAAIGQAPDILPSIARIVLMGGAQRVGGNVTPTAEFNIRVDPEAAKAVFACGRPVVAAPLDLTYRAITTPERLAAIRALGTPVARAAADMLGWYERHDIERYGLPGGPLHDPCTIGWLLRPDLFRGRHLNVVVDTRPGLTRGMTVVDLWGASRRPPNVLWLQDVDADGFYALLTERLGRL